MNSPLQRKRKRQRGRVGRVTNVGKDRVAEYVKMTRFGKCPGLGSVLLLVRDALYLLQPHSLVTPSVS